MVTNLCFNNYKAINAEYHEKELDVKKLFFSLWG